MANAPRDSARGEVERLRARISELENELAVLRQSPPPPGPGAATLPAQSSGRIEHRFHKLLESVGVVFTLVGADGRFLYASPAVLRQIGCEPEALLGQSLFNFIAAEDREYVQSLHEQVLARPGETLGPFELRGIGTDGQVRWSEVFACNLLDDPDVGAIVSWWSDITARRQEEQELREREDQYRQLLENLRAVPWEGLVPDMSAEPTPSFAFRYVGPQAEDLLGYPLEQWYQPGFWEAHLHPDDRDEAIRFCIEACLQGKDHTFEYRMVGADGRVVWVLDVVRVIRVEGEPTVVRGFLVDVSERKESEEARRQLEARMHRTQHLEALGVLAGGIAHEFNNLLTTLLGYTDLARAELPPQSPVQAYLNEVVAAGRRAADLTGQILAYAGKGRFVLQAVVLSELVGQMNPLLATIVSRKATLKLDLSPAVPPVEADVSQLRQVVVNLVTNASEALSEQEGTITVRTATMDLEQPGRYSPHAEPDLPPGRFALLEVADTGKGMDEATRARIFEPFFTTKFTGRGLGLAAVLGIVRGHRGLVHVRSAPGQGTTFQVLLPAREQALGGAGAQAAPARPGSRRVLVVEDDPAVRSLAVLLLEQAGYRVTAVPEGQAGLERFRAAPNDFDVVLLDLTMPGLDGLEVLAELRRLRPGVPVVLMTGYSTSDLARKPGAPAASALLQKPFTSQGLLAALQEALRS